MLPDSKDGQPSLTKTPVRVAVTCAVSLDLRDPELPPCLRGYEVFWAPVPEAAVEEDVKSDAREYNVGSPAAIERKREVDAEAHPCLVEHRAQCKLGHCVSTPVRLHRASRRQRDWRLCRGRQRHCGRDTPKQSPVRSRFAWHALTVGGSTQ